MKDVVVFGESAVLRNVATEEPEPESQLKGCTPILRLIMIFPIILVLEGVVKLPEICPAELGPVIAKWVGMTVAGKLRQ